MNDFSKDQILKIIDDVIEGDKPISSWDDLLSVRRGNPISRYWANRLSEIESRYSSVERGTMIYEEGVQELVKLRSELAFQQEF